MGGDLSVNSKEGSGSTFRLTALVDRVNALPVAERMGKWTAPRRPLSILCAEDHPYGRVVMNTILRELGHNVDFAETGEAAEAVLMDVTLPDLDGVEATQRIRALPGKAGQTPVIGISGHSESGNEQAARAAGMNFYFVKPVSPAKLAQALASLTA